MIRFNNDYSEICHERILEKISELKDGQLTVMGRMNVVLRRRTSSKNS